MSLIRSFLAFLLAIAIAGFAILNRTPIDVTWSPVHEAYALPLYAVALGALGFGFLLGGMSVWANHGSVRRVKRSQKKQIKTLEKELAETTPDTETSDKPPSDFFPALPKKRT